MVTVHRAHGLRFMIYVDDHEPAHVHVFGDGEMKIVIRGANGRPEIVYALGMKTSDQRRAMDEVLDRQAEFMAKWEVIHGGRR